MEGFTAERDNHGDTRGMEAFQTFGCLNLGDYHDLYLKRDKLLLACVF